MRSFSKETAGTGRLAGVGANQRATAPPLAVRATPSWAGFSAAFNRMFLGRRTRARMVGSHQVPAHLRQRQAEFRWSSRALSSTFRPSGTTTTRTERSASSLPVQRFCPNVTSVWSTGSLGHHREPSGNAKRGMACSSGSDPSSSRGLGLVVGVWRALTQFVEEGVVVPDRVVGQQHHVPIEQRDDLLDVGHVALIQEIAA